MWTSRRMVGGTADNTHGAGIPVRFSSRGRGERGSESHQLLWGMLLVLRSSIRPEKVSQVKALWVVSLQEKKIPTVGKPSRYQQSGEKDLNCTKKASSTLKLKENVNSFPPFQVKKYKWLLANYS